MHEGLHKIIVSTFPNETVLVGDEVIDELIQNPIPSDDRFVDLTGGDALDIKLILEILAAAVILGNELVRLYKFLTEEENRKVENPEDLLAELSAASLDQMTKNPEVRAKRIEIARQVITTVEIRQDD